MRNASTGSPWPVTNHPDACYNNRAVPDCNLDIPLWKLLRASTAAPTFFPPEEIQIGPRSHVFVDGGITPYSNPALIAVLMATLPTYRISWPAGRAKLHVLSIGTGRSRIRLPQKLADRINLLDQLSYIAPALISAASVEQDMLCRILGDCRFGHEIDSEVGDLAEASLLSPAEQKFTYARYDPPLDALAGARTAVPLDDIRLIPDFISFGRRYATEHVRREHLQPIIEQPE